MKFNFQNLNVYMPDFRPPIFAEKRSPFLFCSFERPTLLVITKLLIQPAKAVELVSTPENLSTKKLLQKVCKIREKMQLEVGGDENMFIFLLSLITFQEMFRKGISQLKICYHCVQPLLPKQNPIYNNTTQRHR